MKTSDYSIFKYRHDNRTITRCHLNKIIRSIQSNNMLDLKPITVNAEMEILDGQHRFEAAKHLGIEIHYTIDENIKTTDLILMNVAKEWIIADYFNYYIKNGAEEYLKLADLMKKEELSLSVALHICIGRNPDGFNDFRNGKFKFKDDLFKNIEIAKSTIEYVKKMNGRSVFTKTARFWRALFCLFSHPEFDASQWEKNLTKFVNRMTIKATIPDYFETFKDIYNYSSRKRIFESVKGYNKGVDHESFAN